MTTTPLQSIIPKLPTGILYGGDYNPEQWPESVWIEDAELMQKAGVNLVSLAIFSWAKLEPEPGRYDLDWLNRVVDLLWKHDVSVCLATATATPPAWLSRRHPESLPLGLGGERFTHGSRQHYCPNSTNYREASARLATQLAQRFGSHPAVALWHINNEIGCHINACYCDVCAAAFQSWLRARYGSFDVLNDAWHTPFWGQTYSEWSEISLPGRTPTFCNPAQLLDHHRFVNDSMRSIVQNEIAAVRAVVPDAKVTTNGVFVMKSTNYRDWYQLCDVAALDCYPDPHAGLPECRAAALNYDFYRSFKHGLPFILMEQVASQVNWRLSNVLKRPGQMRALSYSAMARGADGIMFFQWRQSRAGAEKFHGALVPHTGPYTRVFRELCQLGQELRSLSRIAGSRVPARVAILDCWDNRWALELPSKPAAFDYIKILSTFHTALWNNHIPTDIASPDDDLTGYDIVIAPVLYQLTVARADALRNYVSRGGTLLATYFTGIADENEHIHLGGYPALLKDVLGLVVEEWQPIPPDTTNGLRLVGSPSDQPAVPCTFFSEVVHLRGAEALATFTDDFLADAPAITRHRFGQGDALYLATQPDQAFLDIWLRDLLSAHGIHAPVTAGPSVEVSIRRSDDEEFLFVINHDRTPSAVAFGTWAGAGDLLDDNRPVTAQENLAPFAVRILHRPVTA